MFADLCILPTETIIEIVNFADFKIVQLLEQTSKKIQAYICGKKVWETLCEQYGLKYCSLNAKQSFIDNTFLNPILLKNVLTVFFHNNAHQNNTFLKCHFKNPYGVLELEKIHDIKEKNSLTIAYIGKIDDEIKSQIKQDVENFISLEEIYYYESYNKNLLWS